MHMCTDVQWQGEAVAATSGGALMRRRPRAAVEVGSGVYARGQGLASPSMDVGQHQGVTSVPLVVIDLTGVSKGEA